MSKLEPIKEPPLLPSYKCRITQDAKQKNVVVLWACEVNAIVGMLDAAAEAVDEFETIQDEVGIGYYGRFRGKMSKLRDLLHAKGFPAPEKLNGDADQP